MRRARKLLTRSLGCRTFLTFLREELAIDFPEGPFLPGRLKAEHNDRHDNSHFHKPNRQHQDVLVGDGIGEAVYDDDDDDLKLRSCGYVTKVSINKPPTDEGDGSGRPGWKMPDLKEVRGRAVNRGPAD